MFQKIIETTNLQDAIIHTLTDGSLISGFEIDLLDEELFDEEKIEAILMSLLTLVPEGRYLRIYLKSEFETESDKDHSRYDELKTTGFVKNRAYVFLEKPIGLKLNYFSKQKIIDQSNLLTDFHGFKSHSLSVKPLAEKDIEEIFPKLNEEINHNFQTIDTGTELLSILRLTKQSEFGMKHNILSSIKDGLLLPYIICVTVSPIAAQSAEVLLRRRSKQNIHSTGVKEARVFEEAESDLEAVALNGTRLFTFEWQCLISRKNEEYLRQDREEFKSRLSPLGEIYIESVGALKSLKSFFPGSAPHFTLIEKDNVLTTYLPLVTKGDQWSKKIINIRSLALHRLDESISYLDILNPKYDSFSWCIFGRPGTGKSVLTNAITRALLNDPNIQVIKLDVGGSHSRETEMLGGIEKTLSLNEPTGINPFDVLKELGSTKEAIQILAAFIEVLILEEGEVKLSKSMKSDLERAVLSYAENPNIKYNLEDFVNNTYDLPRKSLINRWVGTGVYGNAFRCAERKGLETEGAASVSRVPRSTLLGEDAEARSAGSWTASAPALRASALPLAGAASVSGRRPSTLLYFNFSKISQALDPDYAQGGLAAV